MRKLTLLVDADDTIEDLLGPWISILNEEHGTSLTVEDITSWDVAAFFPQLTREQVFTPLYDKNFWGLIEPIKDSVSVLQKLLADGHDLYVVTASNYQTCAAKVERLLELFPFFDWNHIILTSNKQIVRGDILIDDGPHNLVGGEYIKFLFDRPHNRSFNEKEYGIRRVYTWDEIYEAVCEIAKD